MQAGIDFILEDDEKILQINSPKKLIGGPYRVVYKSIPDRWAVVAFCWNGNPRLGLRWFWDTNGNPSSHGHATWLVIPPKLQNAVLEELSLDIQFKDKLNGFLSGKISGKELSEN